MENKAVYAGSFDPVTQGHMWVIREAARLFGEFEVTVGVNPNKKPMFSLEERLEMLRESLDAAGLASVAVGHFADKFLMHYASERGCTHIVRGMRNIDDFEFERMMLNLNNDILTQGEISTVYLIPPRELAEVSSGAVKAICGPEGWERVVERYVPAAVFAKLKEKVGG